MIRNKKKINTTFMAFIMLALGLNFGFIGLKSFNTSQIPEENVSISEIFLTKLYGNYFNWYDNQTFFVTLQKIKNSQHKVSFNLAIYSLKDFDLLPSQIAVFISSEGFLKTNLRPPLFFTRDNTHHNYHSAPSSWQKTHTDYFMSTFPLDNAQLLSLINAQSVSLQASVKIYAEKSLLMQFFLKLKDRFIATADNSDFSDIHTLETADLRNLQAKLATWLELDNPNEPWLPMRRQEATFDQSSPTITPSTTPLLVSPPIDDGLAKAIIVEEVLKLDSAENFDQLASYNRYVNYQLYSYYRQQLQQVDRLQTLISYQKHAGKVFNYYTYVAFFHDDFGAITFSKVFYQNYQSPVWSLVINHIDSHWLFLKQLNLLVDNDFFSFNLNPSQEILGIGTYANYTFSKEISNVIFVHDQSKTYINRDLLSKILSAKSLVLSLYCQDQAPIEITIKGDRLKTIQANLKTIEQMR